ncbi:hypothetical protein [Stenotrophomonas sp. NPDC077659]|uniref:hypothetical protein n=1 Tax=Stenotrophomonas sp. NPDC077659 TaxID=3390694 RepID=UPI003CFF4304
MHTLPLPVAIRISESCRFVPAAGRQMRNVAGQRPALPMQRRINDQWRLCFIWTDSGPESVEIVDYH